MRTPGLRIVSDDGELVVPPSRICVVGRSRTADLVIDGERVSRRHLVIERNGDEWLLSDVSRNGIWYNGDRIESITIAGEIRVRLGSPSGPQVVLTTLPSNLDEAHTCLAGSPVHTREPHPGKGVDANRLGARGGAGRDRLGVDDHSTHQLSNGVISVGRSTHNDIVVHDLLVSRRHAELHVDRNSVAVVDLGSANGTFVNGQRVTWASLQQRDVIAIGHHLFQLQGTTLIGFVDSGNIRLEAHDLSSWAGRKRLMHDISFRLPERSLLAVVGPSGAGKSTLLGALTGFRPADSGSVRYAGRDLYAEYDELRRRIGYVPQEDLLHTALTARTALEYGAELRFPPDVTEEERRARVDEVLAELALSSHADTPVSRLSGGQRKRTSVAMELLTKPSLLYLDEPTSGLDPGLDKSVMTSLRTLADDGRTIIVVTHSVAHLDLCDFVLVMAPGGYTAYFGPPSGALPYFGKRDFPDVFLELEAIPGAEAAARFRASELYVGGAFTAPSARPLPEQLPSLRQQSMVAQLSTLCRRSLRVVISDKSYLRLIVTFPFLLGLLPRVIPAPHGLMAIANEPNRDAPTLLVVLIVGACFMGTANAVREIVKERAIYRRERAVGLSIPAYLGSKAAILALITTMQSVVFTSIGVLGKAPRDAVALGWPLLEVLLAVAVTALASAMLGLVISALVDDADKTMPLLVLATMAQVVFSGGLVPLEGRPVFEQVSWLVPARWGFAALASVTDLNVVSRDVLVRGGDPLWDHTPVTYFTSLLFGTLLGVVAVVTCAYLLRRLDPHSSQRKNANNKAGRSRSPTDGQVTTG